VNRNDKKQKKEPHPQEVAEGRALVKLLLKVLHDLSEVRSVGKSFVESWALCLGAAGRKYIVQAGVKNENGVTS
jgi:hypothetical protein